VGWLARVARAQFATIIVTNITGWFTTLGVIRYLPKHADQTRLSQWRWQIVSEVVTMVVQDCSPLDQSSTIVSSYIRLILIRRVVQEDKGHKKDFWLGRHFRQSNGGSAGSGEGRVGEETKVKKALIVREDMRRG